MTAGCRQKGVYSVNLRLQTRFPGNQTGSLPRDALFVLNCGRLPDLNRFGNRNRVENLDRQSLFLFSEYITYTFPSKDYQFRTVEPECRYLTVCLERGKEKVKGIWHPITYPTVRVR